MAKLPPSRAHARCAQEDRRVSDFTRASRALCVRTRGCEDTEEANVSGSAWPQGGGGKVTKKRWR